MPFSLRTTLNRIPWIKLSEMSVIALLVFSILWKGGKSLETTWLLVLVAWICVYGYYATRYVHATRSIHPYLWSWVILFIVWTGLSYLFSSTGNYGLDEVLRTGALGMLFLWVVRVVREERDAQQSTVNSQQSTFEEKVLRTIAIATLAACIIGVAVYLLQPVNRFVGTFFDHRFHTDYWPNAWAEFLLLAWPVTVWWIVREERIFFPFMRYFVIGVVIACLLLSYSRGVLVAFAGQLCLWTLFIWLRTKKEFPWKRIGTNALIIACVSLGIFFVMNGLRARTYEVQSVTEKVTFTAAEGGSSVAERAQFWQQALELSWDKPLFGWGPYSFRFIQPRLQGAVLATSDHPHNVFLKFAMERGWVAAVLFGVIVFVVMGVIAKYQIRDTKYEKGHYSMNAQHMIFLSLAGVLAHNLIDYNLQFVGIALPFWLLLGILAAHLRFPERRSLNKKLVRFVEVLLICSLLVIAVLEARYIILSSLGRHAEARGENAAALVWYERSKGALFPRDLNLSRAKILFEESRLPEANTAIDDYFKVNGEDARAWKRRAEIALEEGRSEDALKDFERAYRMNRYNDLSIMHGLVRAYRALDRFREFDERRQEFDSLMVDFGDAISTNTHFIALSPNVEELIALAELFADIYRKDSPRYQVLAARADHHAGIERERIAARPPGFLW